MIASRDGAQVRRLGSAALAGVIAFAVVCTAVQWLRADLDWMRAPLSFYLVDAHGLWVRIVYTGLSVSLVLLGVYLLVVAASTGQMTARWAVWVLPFALTVDNLTYGLAGEQTGSVAGEALAQALSSGMLAYLGLFAAVWLRRVIPAKVETTRFAGAALLVGAGALVLLG